MNSIIHEAMTDCTLWRMVFDKAGVGICVLNKDGHYLEANQRWLEMFGYAMGMRDPGGHDTRAQMLAGFNGRVAALLRGEEDEFRVEKCYCRWNGTSFWGDLSVSLLRDGTGAPALAVGFLVDVSERKQAEQLLQQMIEDLRTRLLEHRKAQEELAQLAVRDPLTGLFNRRFMEESLQRELCRCRREGIPLSLVMMDLDHFKILNDTHGHQAGDRVLKILAELLVSNMRGEDVVCRFGGEEFVAILPGAALNVAAQRTEYWRSLFENATIRFEGTPLPSTLSAGIAEFPRHGTTGEDLLSQADGALYQAKRGGRNRVMVGL